MKQLVRWRHFTPTWIYGIAMDSIARVNIFIEQFIEPLYIYSRILVEFRIFEFSIFLLSNWRDTSLFGEDWNS